MSKIYNEIVPVVTDLSGISSTKLIVGNTFIGHLENFSVTVKSSATQVIQYRIQLSPSDDSNWFATAGSNQSATAVAIGSSVQLPVSNLFQNNTMGYIRIEASGLCSIVQSPIVVKISGMVRRG
jgi:hypothetical protein